MRRTTTLVVGTSFLTLSIGMSIYALYQNQRAGSQVSKRLIAFHVCLPCTTTHSILDHGVSAKSR